jgi:hypothetical protein
MRDPTRQAERLLAVGLLTRRHWRSGDVAALQAVALRLGLEVVPPDTNLLGNRSEAG